MTASGGTNEIVRVRCIPPLTKTQLRVAELLSLGHSVEVVAKRFGVGTTTIKFHVREAASRIPGDLPARFKIIAWYRGAALSVLELQSAPDAVLRRALGIQAH